MADLRPEDLDRRPDVRAPAVARRLFKLVDGGAFPNAAGRFHLGLPIDLDGPETEGASPTAVAATSLPEPVLVLGSRPPGVGDLVVATGVGGRWVASVGKPPNVVYCGGCSLPKTDLTVSSFNWLFGTETVPLVFDGGSSWVSACFHELTLRLTCGSGGAIFSVTYYSGGACPSGTPSTCSTTSGSGLTLTSSSCDPFLIDVAVTGCPVVASIGFTRFLVTK